MEKLGKDQDPLEDVKFDLKPVALDFQRLAEMADSERGHSHMQCLVKHWEYKRASDVQALEEELDLLCQQRKEIEQKIVQKRQQILEEQRIHDQSCDTVKGKVPILDEGKITPSCDQELEMDAEHGSVSHCKERAMQLEETVYQEHKMDAECDIISFWKERVKQLEEKLQACLQRERSLVEKTEGSIRNPPSHAQFEGLSALLKMGDDYLVEPENEVAQSMWPENIGDKHQRQFRMEKFRKDQDAFKDVKFDEKPVHVDFQRLMEMANSEKGVSHMQYFMKHWEYKRANAARLLEEEIGLLSQQRKEIEQNKQQILEEQRFQDESYYAVKRHVPILDEAYEDEWKRPCKKNDEFSLNREPKIDADYDSVAYWKERATQLEKTLEESIQREHSLVEKLEENIKNLQSHTPAEEFSGMLERADYFLHLVLQSAPIVIAHQDADLRYRFIFNHYPTLADEDVIGKTDYEIWSGEGIEEMNSVKREVMATGIATKREFVLNTQMFGAKTFVTYIEPVFSKGGETIGVNSVAMDITDQVKRREKMADIRVREAIQKAKETELNRSLHVTGQKEK